MRIALAFPGCHRRGGVERVVWECAHFLAERGHRIDVYANEWEDDDNAGINYRYVKMLRHPFFLRGQSFFSNCTRACSEAEFDVLNTHGCVCPLGGVHRVHSVHRAWLEVSRTLRSPLSAARLRQRLNPLHLILLRLEREHFRARRYRKVIALTEQVRYDLRRFYGVPPEDVVIIPNGFSTRDFNPKAREGRRLSKRRELGLADGDIAMLFVANELDRKGYETILEALRILARRDVRLLMVGRTDEAIALRKARVAGVEDRVMWCGPTDDVAAFHAAADLFVLPTQYEAFCLAILEALGSGLPVVTSSVPGARDAIVEGVNGYTVADPRNGEELADKIRVLLDPDRRALLSGTAPQTVVQYQWPHVLAMYERVLEECASKL